MNEKFDIFYSDRATGKLMTEKIYASPFLYWSYNTNIGKWATDLIFRTKIASRLYGWFNHRKWSAKKIGRFVRDFDIDIREFPSPIEDFASFNDFFVREIDPSKRPINSKKGVCIAPVDGKVLVYPVIDCHARFRIKRCTFNLSQLVCDTSVASRFDGGSMLISRLSLKDYHHFHFPDSGIPGSAKSISGKYYAGGPYALRSLVPFYTENYRMVTRFDSDHFGPMAIMEIGAFTVGSIRQCFQPGAHIAKGAHKGFFEMGGSTVVLLFRKGAIEFDEDLVKNSSEETETFVKFGDSVGNAVGNQNQRRGLAC